MENLAKYDLEAMLHMELKTDCFVQKVVVLFGFFLSDSRSAVDLYPCFSICVCFWSAGPAVVGVISACLNGGHHVRGGRCEVLWDGTL